ncbi:unnamed protein product, partial [Ascophyllum nodosum]
MAGACPPKASYEYTYNIYLFIYCLVFLVNRVEQMRVLMKATIFFFLRGPTRSGKR